MLHRTRPLQHSKARRGGLRIPSIAQLPYAFFGALSLAACAVTTEPSVQSEGGPLASGKSVSFATPSGDGREADLLDALKVSFSSRGFASQDAGDYRVEYSISKRPAVIGIAFEPPSGSTSAPVTDSAERHDKRIFRKCRAQRVRVVVVAYPRSGVGDVARAWGESDDCEFSRVQLDAIVEEVTREMTDS